MSVTLTSDSRKALRKASYFARKELLAVLPEPMAAGVLFGLVAIRHAKAVGISPADAWPGILTACMPCPRTAPDVDATVPAAELLAHIEARTGMPPALTAHVLEKFGEAATWGSLFDCATHGAKAALDAFEQGDAAGPSKHNGRVTWCLGLFLGACKGEAALAERLERLVPAPPAPTQGDLFAETAP
jgi:hypothetical protein